MDTQALVAWLVAHVDECDPVSRGHSWRVSQYVDFVAQSLGVASKERQQLVQAALLHDVGKIAVAKSLLSHPGPLLPHEAAEVQRHAELGGRMLASMPALAHAAEVARWHHERWDGQGYPGSLTRTQVPFAARFVSVLDALDAMTSPRAYRQPMPLSSAICELRIHAGSQFDPEIVGVVCALDLESVLSEFEKKNTEDLCNDQVAA
jgi:HD-GYP domain-containing protein (c-di-GMP phosphodiesterase class II)